MAKARKLTYFFVGGALLFLVLIFGAMTTKAIPMVNGEPDEGKIGTIYVKDQTGEETTLFKIDSQEELDQRLKEINKKNNIYGDTIVFDLKTDWKSEHFITNNKQHIGINLNEHTWEITGNDSLELGNKGIIVISKVKELSIKNGTMKFTGTKKKAKYPLYLRNVSLSIENVKFEDCNTKGKSIIYYDRWGLISICSFILKNVSFINCNRNGAEGAVIYFNANKMEASSSAISDSNCFMNCTFSNCQAGDGGAIFIDGSKNSLYFSGCKFENCKASGYAGAIYFNGSDSKFTFNNCQFINCSAHKEGGAFILDSKRISLTFKEGTEFNQCKSDNDAGAIWLNSNNGVILGGMQDGALGCKFINCSASGDGGAIKTTVKPGKGNHCEIKNVEFIGNKATSGDGGALCLSGDDCSVINCNFEKNNASKRGGAIYARYKNIIDKCNFKEDSANSSQEIEITAKSKVTNSDFKSKADKGALCNIDIWSSGNNKYTQIKNAEKSAPAANDNPATNENQVTASESAANK